MFLQTNPALLKRLIRPPYGAFEDLSAKVQADAPPNDSHRDPRVDRDWLYDMRMPPYMRDSDASPLSLTRRQYQFLMDVLKRVQAPAAGETTALKASLNAAQRRRPPGFEPTSAITWRRLPRAASLRQAKKGSHEQRAGGFVPSARARARALVSPGAG